MSKSFKKRRLNTQYLQLGFKKRRLNPNLKMVSAAFYIPKHNKSKPQGEDAHFICPYQQTIGVADGVGGWSNHGVDAGEYARQLMLNSVFAVHKQVSSFRGGDEVVDPKSVLQEAFNATSIFNLQGSSTACIVTHNDGFLHAVNVGDSGFLLFRENKCIYRSPTQQKEFNHPYQLGNSAKSDRPDCALELKVAVMSGDVIVLATDGLLDNMFSNEIEEILKKQSNTEEGIIQPKELSFKIAQTAHCRSLDQYYESPYATASKLVGKKRKGGKIDDITVTVGHIVQEPSWEMLPLSS